MSGKEQSSDVGDPLFASVTSKPVGAGYVFADFGVQPDSPVMDRGRYNTRVDDSGGGRGQDMPVRDPHWFRDRNGNPKAPWSGSMSTTKALTTSRP